MNCKRKSVAYDSIVTMTPCISEALPSNSYEARAWDWHFKMVSWRQVSKLNQALFPQFESLKHGRLAKVYYLMRDYKSVGVSALNYAKDRPFKVLFQLSGLGLFSYAWHKNPDMSSYVDTLMESSSKLLQVSSLIRNKSSDMYVREVVECYYQKRLTRKNLGLFSLILKTDIGTDCDLFENKCYYTKERWITLSKRIVDIGFLGRWYELEKAMRDFDINEEEFQFQ